MSYARLDYPTEVLAPFGRDRLLMECNTDIEARMRLVACAKEPWTVSLIETMSPGECFWDVGANVGSYALIAAARGVGVIAFEPVSENLGTLARNLALNNLLQDVIVVPVALGDENAMIWQHRSDMQSGAAGHLHTADARKRGFHQQLVPLITADTARALWGLPCPNVLKIDVDGFEPQVLAGAAGILADPTLRALLIEMQVANDAGLIAWLAERGWEIDEQYPERGGIYYARYRRC